ncbi:MAG: hypothetical protein Kow00105_10860 [Phycisphaeraceae bacterium]
MTCLIDIRNLNGRPGTIDPKLLLNEGLKKKPLLIKDKKGHGFTSKVLAASYLPRL